MQPTCVSEQPPPPSPPSRAQCRLCYRLHYGDVASTVTKQNLSLRKSEGASVPRA